MIRTPLRNNRTVPFAVVTKFWSIDAWWKGTKNPVWVHPWPIRLLFTQMIFIYFMNGVYKLCGVTWREGNSLHYVLGDLALTRFSQTWLPLPIVVTRLLTAARHPELPRARCARRG